MKALLNLISSLRSRSVFVAVLLTFTALFSAHAQSPVKGKVVDEDGRPVAGVTVMVKGTTNGTMTDMDGIWTLRVKEGDVLEFSCLGLATQTHRCDSRTANINITMKEDSQFIEETIVVGYGTQKKSSMTSAVSAMKGEELLKAPSTNVSQVLAGKLPGISSVQESGQPGEDQASLRIRGNIRGVSYVVDGFPVSDINDIDPADIESISVLKDGASAAVYGFGGSGGVIIISTKKGQKGQTKITYNASFGASMNANFPKFMNGPQFAYYYNVAEMMDQLARGVIKDDSEYKPYFTKHQVEMMLNGDPSDGWDNVNYIDEVFGTGFNQKHSVTVQGGNDKTRYFASFGYLGQKGNIDNFGYRRYNVRANLESRIAKNFNFTLGLSGVIGKKDAPYYNAGSGESVIYGGSEATGWLSIANQTIQMHPYLPKTYNGLYTASTKKNTGLPQSPLAAIYDSGFRKNSTADVSVNTSLSYDVPFLEGLQLKVSGSYMGYTANGKTLYTPYSLMSSSYDSMLGEWVWKKVNSPNGVGAGNTVRESANWSRSLIGQASISYIHSFGKHNLDLLALAEIRDWKANGLGAAVKEVPFPSLPELSYGRHEEGSVYGNSNATRSAGYVVRARYNYDERYLAEFSARVDGSYKFAGMTKTRWGFFPSFSLGWNMAKEHWLENASCLDDLKLRASVGLLGNDSVSPYSYLSAYAQGGKVVLGNTVNPSYYTNVIASPNLSWEKISSYNVGLDLNMWNGKLGAEIDAYYSYTYDMLVAQGTDSPPSMGGYYPTFINGNAIDTGGIDIMLSHKNTVMLAGQPFTYGIAGSITYAKSRYIIYPDQPNIPEYQKVTGTEVGSIMTWIADGLYRTEEEIDNSAWYGTRPCIGDIKYVDINGDGKIDHDDKCRIGRNNRPQLTYGLNLNFSWYGFDLSAQFTGGALFDVSLTGTYFNHNDDNTVWTQTFKEGANSPLYLVENAYSIYNPNGTFPRLTLSNPGHGGANGLGSTFWLRDGKYIRLKTAQLGYTFPRKWMERIKIDTLRLFVEGQNLFTIDGLPKGIDPESPGTNNGYYPQQRLLMGGLTLTF